MVAVLDKTLDGTPWTSGLTGLSNLETDVLTKEVISQVECCLEQYALADAFAKGDKPLTEHVEVEGRLGVFLDPFTNDRLKLPVETEALLSETSSAMSYRFNSAVSQYHFECFCRNLKHELGLVENNTSAGNTQSQDLLTMGVSSSDTAVSFKPVSREISLETKDVILSYSPNGGIHKYDKEKPSAEEPDNRGGAESRIRLSLDPQTNKVMEAIRKEAFVKLNVFSGRDPHEEEVELLLNESGNASADELRTAMDFRVSINREINVPVQIWSNAINQPQNNKTFIRRRSRKSYPLFGIYRIDCTVVQTQTGLHGKGDGRRHPPPTSHELELEINPYALYHHHLLKRQGNPASKFDEIIVNFVNILRSWVALLNTSGTRELLTKSRNADDVAEQLCGADLRLCAADPNDLEQYIEHFSPVVPLIGDYAFRWVASRHAAQLDDAQKIKEADLYDLNRLHLSEKEVEHLIEKGLQLDLS